MPEADIVSAARTPIGRTNKGPLRELRPDGLAAIAIRGVVDKVEGLEPSPIADLLLGCGLPGGEPDNDLARVLSVLNGRDSAPGAMVTRYCSSSAQTTRTAFHAIKAGEGDVFVSAGEEWILSFAKGSSGRIPHTIDSLLRDAQSRTMRTVDDQAAWHDPRRDGMQCRRRPACRLTYDVIAGLAEVFPKDGVEAVETTALSTPARPPS